MIRWYNDCNDFWSSWLLTSGTFPTRMRATTASMWGTSTEKRWFWFVKISERWSDFDFSPLIQRKGDLNFSMIWSRKRWNDVSCEQILIGFQFVRWDLQNIWLRRDSIDKHGLQSYLVELSLNNIFGCLPGQKISLVFCQAKKYPCFFARPKNIFGSLPGQKISFVVCQANHVRLSMKDENAPNKGGIEPTFFRLGLIIFCFCFYHCVFKINLFSIKEAEQPAGGEETAPWSRNRSSSKVSKLFPRWAIFFQVEPTF